MMEQEDSHSKLSQHVTEEVNATGEADISRKSACIKATTFSSLLTLAGFINSVSNYFHIWMLSSLDKRAREAGSFINTQLLTVGVAYMVLNSIGGKLISSAIGSKNYEKIDPIYKNGLAASLLLTIPSGLVVLNIGPILKLFKQPEDIADIIQTYSYSYACGIPAILLLNVQRQVPIGMQKPVPVVAITFFNETLKSGLAYYLKSKYKVAGIGMGSSIAAYVALALFTLHLRYSSTYEICELKIFSLQNILGYKDIFKDIFKIGLPMGLQLLSDVLALVALTHMLGSRNNSDELSAHTIATQYFLLGLTPLFAASQAGSSFVAKNMQNLTNAKRLGNACIMFGVSASALYFLLLGTLNKKMMSPFINVDDIENYPLVDLTRNLLIATGAGQLFDAIRIVGAGTLQGEGGVRGTKYALKVGVVAMCAVSIGLGYLLGFPAGLGVSGLYIARDVGMVLGGSAMLYKWCRLMNRSQSECSQLPKIQIHSPSMPIQETTNDISSKVDMQSESASEPTIQEENKGVNDPLVTSNTAAGKPMLNAYNMVQSTSKNSRYPFLKNLVKYIKN
jgi:MATE family, multidrug efflux pump